MSAGADMLRRKYCLITSYSNPYEILGFVAVVSQTSSAQRSHSLVASRTRSKKSLEARYLLKRHPGELTDPLDRWLFRCRPVRLPPPTFARAIENHCIRAARERIPEKLNPKPYNPRVYRAP